jgi:hypothetical protein
VRLSPLATIWPTVSAQDAGLWVWSSGCNDWQGKPKTCSNAILSTTNPTWPGPGLELGYHGGKPGTSRMSYGMALSFSLSFRCSSLLPFPVFCS